MGDLILTETRGRILLITLNRPQARNAFDAALADALVERIERLDEDRDLSVGILTGAEGGFSAGMDLKAFAAEGVPRNLGTFLERGSRKPLIAAIEGFALAGGLEVALACDLLVAAKGVRLGLPEVKRGLVAAGGGLFRLPARIPYGAALELVLTGDPIDAERALELGLVSRLAEPGRAVEVAFELAERIAANAPLAVATSKQIVRDSLGRREAKAWEAQAKAVQKIFASKDAREGARAFAEKRPPAWRGR